MRLAAVMMTLVMVQVTFTSGQSDGALGVKLLSLRQEGFQVGSRSRCTLMHLARSQCFGQVLCVLRSPALANRGQSLRILGVSEHWRDRSLQIPHMSPTTRRWCVCSAPGLRSFQGRGAAVFWARQVYIARALASESPASVALLCSSAPEDAGQGRVCAVSPNLQVLSFLAVAVVLRGPGGDPDWEPVRSCVLPCLKPQKSEPPRSSVGHGPSGPP